MVSAFPPLLGASLLREHHEPCATPPEDGPMRMRDLINKLKERPKAVQDHRNEQRTEWRDALNGLFTTIEGWLRPAVEAGVLTTSQSLTEIVEPDLGSYMAPLLRISDGLITARLEPVGGRVAGIIASGNARLVGLRGRVDLVCGPMKVPLVRTSSGVWQALPLRGEPRELTEETFAELLGEVLLDD
jgi:hypothetical protein